jgi:carboxylate-amine ligase
VEKLKFTSNATPSIGVEIEMALVDPETGALTSAVGRVLDRLPAELQGKVKPELMQCCVEVNSETCQTVEEVGADLRHKLRQVQHAADAEGVGLFWTGTHPFSLWQDQRQSPSERYAKLLELLQDLGRQLITFGLHVHVGVDSGDKAIAVVDRILNHLPVLLALSANSPWWEARPTGLLSHRSKVMEMLPTAGLPPLMSNWSEYVWLVNHLTDTGFVNSIREIWWDVRPHNNFGTVEVRICDTPGNLEDALTLAALTQCLVVSLSDEIDYGTYQHAGHPMMIRQNKWRAARYGLDANIVDAITYEAKTARDCVRDLCDHLAPTGDRLGCADWLERARVMAAGPTWAERQLAASARGPSGAIREMMRRSRLE